MNLLIIGQGGREHAFYTKFVQEREAQDAIWVLPGNGGFAKEHRISGDVLNFALIRQIVKEREIDTVFVGPEVPLVHGIVEALKDLPVFVFGPNQQAAQLEGSKVFAKDFMHRHNIPTADYASFTDLSAAENYCKSMKYPIVVKASGLAAGKGVSICMDNAQAMEALRASFSGDAFGEAGKEVVIETCLTGKEASLFLLCDGESYQILGTAQDYKRAYEGNQGPNTGGMGAFSPAQILSVDVMERVNTKIIERTMHGLKKDKIEYIGILYIGLMVQADGEPFVIEYNCRMGDPEAQVVVPLLESSLKEIFTMTKEKRINSIQLKRKKDSAITVVLAAEGYPGVYAKGIKLFSKEEKHPFALGSVQRNESFEDIQIFHAGTEINSAGDFISQGGRVLNVTGIGKNLNDAAQKSYQVLLKYPIFGLFYRKDIGSEYI